MPSKSFREGPVPTAGSSRGCKGGPGSVAEALPSKPASSPFPRFNEVDSLQHTSSEPTWGLMGSPQPLRAPQPSPSRPDTDAFLRRLLRAPAQAASHLPPGHKDRPRHPEGPCPARASQHTRGEAAPGSMSHHGHGLRDGTSGPQGAGHGGNHMILSWRVSGCQDSRGPGSREGAATQEWVLGSGQGGGEGGLCLLGLTMHGCERGCGVAGVCGYGCGGRKAVGEPWQPPPPGRVDLPTSGSRWTLSEWPQRSPGPPSSGSGSAGAKHSASGPGR